MAGREAVATERPDRFARRLLSLFPGVVGGVSIGFVFARPEWRAAVRTAYLQARPASAQLRLIGNGVGGRRRPLGSCRGRRGDPRAPPPIPVPPQVFPVPVSTPSTGGNT